MDDFHGYAIERSYIGAYVDPALKRGVVTLAHERSQTLSEFIRATLKDRLELEDAKAPQVVA